MKKMGKSSLFKVSYDDSGRPIGLFDTRTTTLQIPCEFGDIGPLFTPSLRQVSSEAGFVGIFDTSKQELVVPTIHTRIIEHTEAFILALNEYTGDGAQVHIFYNLSSQNVLIIGPQRHIKSLRVNEPLKGRQVFEYPEPKDFSDCFDPGVTTLDSEHILVQWEQDLPPRVSRSYWKSYIQYINTSTGKIVKEW
jgi:hypothetical protein